MRFHVVLCAILLVSVNTASAQTDFPALPLFAADEPLELRIQAPFRQLARDEADDREEYDAVVEVIGPESSARALDIEIRIRGNSRVSNCRYPPLSLDFPRDAVAGTVFAGQNRLKLVTLCGSQRHFHDYLAQEYLIYRMLNELTERSFRVRWATVEYVTTDGRRNREESRTEPAFLIEEDWEVAERLGLDVLELESIDAEMLDAEHSALLTVFQYLIGNEDFELVLGPTGEPCCHNGKLIGREGEPVIFLPYDFDNAGIINAVYAVPNPSLPITRITQRHWRGFCVHNDAIAGAIEAVNARRDELISLAGSERVSERKRGRSVSYIEESYEIINDPDEAERELYGDCRK